MKEITPKVKLIAQTYFDDSMLAEYLFEEYGVEDYIPEAEWSEGLVMAGGKLCYRSWKPGLNANVSRTREDPEEYIGNVLASGHGSVLEHASVSFIFYNVSRVFTHELARHRVGIGMSQESLRYVRLDELSFWTPKILKDMDNENGDGEKLIRKTIKMLEQIQSNLHEIYKIDEIEDFATKKKLTSAFRRLAPIGLGTCLIYTMNMRAARHLIAMRTSRHSEEEIRLVFGKVAETMGSEFPHLFQDMHYRRVGGYREYYFENAAMPYDKSDDEVRQLKIQIKQLQNELKQEKEKAEYLSDSQTGEVI